jgi:glycosyltransferase involved in cell wall biosynthesis
MKRLHSTERPCTQKVKVLIFTNSFLIGGSERQAVELIKCIDRTRFEPYLACLRKDGPLFNELPDDFKDIPSYPLSGFFNVTAFRQALKFLRYLRDIRVHVVQCFDFYSNLFAIPLARLAGVPVVLGARREEAVTKTWSQRTAERWCYRLATGVVANAEAIKAQLVQRDGLPQARVWTVHNGLDIQRFDDRSANSEDHSDRNGLTIGVVANLRPEKGHAVFLDAATHLRRLYPGLKFLIVGDGYYRRQVEANVNGLGLADVVRMTGAVADIPAILRTIDIAVLPSLSNEGFPNSVMEAMAARLPVVATDTGGTRELVLDGETGYLIPPGNASILVDRLARLCDDRQLRMKMGELGRRRIEQEFTVAKMSCKLESLYRTLLNSSVRFNGSMACEAVSQENKL